MFGMTQEQFRFAVWNGLFLADYQVRYWERYQGRIARYAVPIRIILALASVLSLVGLFLAKEYHFIAAVIGAIAAFIATIIIPALKWDGIPEKVAGLRHDWIALREGYRAIWNEIGDVEQLLLEKQFSVWNARDVELEQRNTGLPKIRSFQEDAFDETQSLLTQ